MWSGNNQGPSIPFSLARHDQIGGGDGGIGGTGGFGTGGTYGGGFGFGFMNFV
jgi:hypothetical protein